MERALVWFRRDLRVDDHAALAHALRAAKRVYCVFVFDREILDPLPELRPVGATYAIEDTGFRCLSAEDPFRIE